MNKEQRHHRRGWAALPAMCLLVCGCSAAASKESTSSAKDSPPQSSTIYVDCNDSLGARHVVDPVSWSSDHQWSAYVSVDTTAAGPCSYTSRLWISQQHQPYKVAYVLSPKPLSLANGMRIVGWLPQSHTLLGWTETWQVGSDAPDVQGLVAIDAETGLVREPDLEIPFQQHKQERCSMRLMNAKFAGSTKPSNILLLLRFSTFVDVDETAAEVPASQHCFEGEETWSYSLGDGPYQRVANGTFSKP